MAIDDDGRQVTFSSLRGPLREVPSLSRPNQDPTIRAWRLLEGSPTPTDTRLYLDVHALEHLLAQAQSSPTLRAVLHGVVVDVELREDRTGHRYQVMKFSGVPAPEWSSAATDLLASKRDG